ncbi:MAG: hypothetical protein WBA76_15770 [Phormidesmis sp.]
MSRQKRKSDILAQAEQRLLGMKNIGPKLDLGGGCTTDAVEKQVNEVRDRLSKYHALLSQADAASNELERAEKVLARLSKKVLKGVAVKYDEDSDQYEMVGGVRLSDRKRSRRRAAPLANA